MADIKREIRTLGQRLSGLTAGNTYTFVLKRPNVRVDIVNALRGLEIAEEQIAALRKLLASVDQLRGQLAGGDASSGRDGLKSAKAVIRAIGSGIADAKEFAVRAAEDAKDAHADVKDAYSAAKEGTEHAVGIAENMLSGMGDIMKALTALCVDAEMQEPPAPAASPNTASTPAP